MWCWTRRIVICVVLGVGISVAVAWSCALLQPIWSSGEVTDIEVAHWAARHGFSTEFDEDDYVWMLEVRPADGFGLTRRHYGYFVVHYILPAHGYVHQGRTVEAGWPTLCLRADQIWEREKPRQRVVVSESGWWHWRGEESLQNILPNSPIPLGLAANTLTYAAVCFALFWGRRAVRGALRYRRGGCPLCGYDLRGHFAGGCPECGWKRESQGSDSS